MTYGDLLLMETQVESAGVRVDAVGDSVVEVDAVEGHGVEVNVVHVDEI